ncbi:hypothetical protein HUO14_03615 [Parasphingorhabdus flavimaris]|uniref:Lipoprotein n=1 Tax=Parasphingorhabdus flavimaris TaxID=266812 RepID=A0ABX2MZX3_9SPHN|nr:hypothetical protein [Parasphingorhabdus flavimaris]NVD26995.1 hypothetical protein [Parasphingorhabdus flavimaris]|tara:strand:+ start:667 stop:1143 length:477 start_codon:yes stop_codon:yes gene_type:complete
MTASQPEYEAMSRLIKMPLITAAILALAACGASEAPAAGPASDSSEGAMDASKPDEDVTRAGAAQQVIIRGFECGDNCYLDYSLAAPAPDADTAGETRSALCSVDACIAWFEEQAMPPAFIGRSATVTLGLGEQYDNEGTVMSDDFPLITSIKVDPAP